MWASFILDRIEARLREVSSISSPFIDSKMVMQLKRTTREKLGIARERFVKE